jgi:hypothetical protein
MKWNITFIRLATHEDIARVSRHFVLELFGSIDNLANLVFFIEKEPDKSDEQHLNTNPRAVRSAGK